MLTAVKKLREKLAWLMLWIRHWFRKIFLAWKPENGLQTFLEHYAGDAIFPVSESERSSFPAYQKCQACSLCTFSCVAIQEGRAPSSFEPKFIMLGYGRSSHESEFFLEEWLPCIECQACTVTCPNDVPVHAMAQQIIDRRKQIGFRSTYTPD